MILNPAFELLRQHKEVKEETEKLVMKRVRGRISQDELLTVFENGLSGQYGKLYSADPQTLIGWVDQYENKKNSKENYLNTVLLQTNVSDSERIEWDKEANKCYRAFLNGVNEQYFHHGVYMRMVIDDKIQIGSLYKYQKYSGQIGWTEDLRIAARKVLRDIFLDYKNKGYEFIYVINR